MSTFINIVCIHFARHDNGIVNVLSVRVYISFSNLCCAIKKTRNYSRRNVFILSNHPPTSTRSRNSLSKSDVLALKKEIISLTRIEFHNICRDHVNVATSIHKITNHCIFIITISCLMPSRDTRLFKEKLERLVQIRTRNKLGKLLMGVCVVF